MRQTTRTAIIAATVTALLTVPLTVLAASGFSDVDDGAFYADAVTWLADTGLTKGCNPPENTKFCPEKQVTRGQLAVFLERLAKGRVVDADTVRGMSPTDLQGAEGPTGPMGPAGPAGPKGDTGATGPAGPQGSVGPAGPAGPKGDQGDQGPAGTGVTGYEIRTSTHNFTSTGGRQGLQAICPSGKVALGGAYSASPDGTATIHGTSIFYDPNDSMTGTYSYYGVEYTPTADGSMTVSATCASAP